jgi:hypothetical protein
MAAGLLKKMQPTAIDWPITLRRWNMIIPISRLEFAIAKKTVRLRTTHEKSFPY